MKIQWIAAGGLALMLSIGGPAALWAEDAPAERERPRAQQRERGERAERGERGERGERPQREARPQRGERPEAGARGEWSARPQMPTREELIKKFDKDGDGQLNEEERAAARAHLQELREKHMAERREAARAAGRFVPPTRAELIEKFDKDGDGTLNEEERAAARKHVEELRAKHIAEHGQPQRPGPRGERGQGARGGDGERAPRARTPRGGEGERPAPRQRGQRGQRDSSEDSDN